MIIPRAIQAVIIEWAYHEAPDECCGVMGVKDGEISSCHTVLNLAHSPVNYEMDAGQLLTAYSAIEAAGEDIGVIYHSHLSTPAYPSKKDIELATWPGARYLIVSLADLEHPDLRLFDITDGVVTEEPIEA